MWVKDGKIFKTRIILDGRLVYNPSNEQLKQAGYRWVEPEREVHEWGNKALFVQAVYQLVPDAAIPAVLADAGTAKAAIAGITMLTTEAAPGNLIDLLDQRVADWLAVSGVTVEQVREVMKQMEVSDV